MKESKLKKRKPQGPNYLLFGLVGGGILLLGMCCIGSAVAGFFIYRATAVGDPEKELIGQWRYDGTFGNHVHLGSLPNMEFKEDGTFNLIDANPAFRHDNGKWRQISKEGHNITVEVTYKHIHVHPGREFVFDRTETLILSFPSRNVLHRRFNVGANGGIRYKRV